MAATLTTKLAVNAYLITMVTGLVEAVADRSGLDRALLAEVLRRGPLLSPLLEAKLDKLLTGDSSAQAAIDDVAKNTGLVAAAAGSVGACHTTRGFVRPALRATATLGHGEADMIEVLRAFEAAALVR